MNTTFEERNYNDGQQMSTLQKSDHLSIQYEYAKLNTEDGESLPLSDDDEDDDKELLKI